jgi:hypothetical protein
MSFIVGGVMAGGATTGVVGIAGALASAGGNTGKDKSGAFTAGGVIVGTAIGGEPDVDETGWGVGIGSTGGRLVEAGEAVLGFDGVAETGIVADGIPAAG